MKDSDRLTRYLNHKKKWRAYGCHWTAFQTRRDERGISIFVTEGLKEGVVWQLGDEYCSTRDGRGPEARGDLQVRDVSQCGLDVVRDDDPYLHAEIRGLPSEREEAMDMAKQLAEKATLVMRRAGT